MSDKKHYFLIAGVVMYSIATAEGQEPQIGSAPTNAIVRHDDSNFPAAKLAKAQQNLHKAFAMKLPEEIQPQIHDIVINAVSYLGYMTEEEFQKPAEAAEPKPVIPEVL